MAFGRSELTKEDLIKAGFNPDDLAEMKANGVKKADLDTLKTELATSVTDMIKAQFSELETKLRTPPVVDDKGNKGDEVDEQTEWLSDPLAFINKKVGQSVAFSAVSSTKMRMDLALDRAKTTLRGFKNENIAKEILDEWALYNPQQLAMNKDFDPDKLLKKVHDSVMGAHIDEIERDTAKKEGKFNMVASGGSGGGNSGGNGNIITKKPEESLTEVELAQARKFGMTATEWAEQQKQMEDEESKVMARS